jgi:sodium/potassium-transporting ATPase subunit alpha
MDNEKNVSDEKEANAEVTQTAGTGGDQRIQFTPNVRPARNQGQVNRDDDISAYGVPITHRSRSVASIPQVISEKAKIRQKHEKEQEKKNVDIDEHLMPHEHVAARYKTRINMEKPGESLGLTTQEAEELLAIHGPNILTPPKKRNAFLKFWDSLSSLFNLLLILAGVLEYILLGISYKNNFQNVRISGSRRVHLLIRLSDLLGCHSDCSRFYQCLHRVLSTTEVASPSRVVPQHDSSQVSLYARW